MASISTAEELLLDESLGLTRPHNLEMPEITDYDELVVYAEGLANAIGTTLQDAADLAEVGAQEEVNPAVDAVVYGELDRVSKALEIHGHRLDASHMQEKLFLILESLEERIPEFEANDEYEFDDLRRSLFLKREEDREQEENDFFSDGRFITAKVEAEQ